MLLRSGLVVAALLATSLVHAELRSVDSPSHRVAVLELYTSEGCSSCPPADRWLSQLRTAGISERKLVPMAFHVTYWDYIGWKDRFGDVAYDQRQRLHGRINELRTIYTPQFVLDGSDFRRHGDFTSRVRAITEQPAQVDLRLSLQRQPDEAWTVMLDADIARSDAGDVALFIVLRENKLQSAVEDGENEGETLHHDYVVRLLHGPVFVSKPDQQGRIRRGFYLPPGWKAADIGVVGFAQNLHSGEILQAVSMPLLEPQAVVTE